MSGTTKSILVAEDDESYREMIVALLTKKGYFAKGVANGKLALNELMYRPFDLVVSDVKMPVMHGLDLLGEIKKKFPKMPVILMTGFSYILETQEAQSLGADDFILKPFQTMDFLKLISRYCSLDFIHKEDRVDVSLDYFAIPIDEFVTGSTLLYDIYIKLTNYKFLKVASVDDVLARDAIEKYKSRGVDVLYVNKEDYRLYLGFNMQVYYAVDGNKKFSKETKARLMANISSLFSALTFEGEIDDQLVEEMKDFCVKGFSLISEHDDLLAILNSIHDASAEEAAHGVAVAFIASAIAKKMSWFSKGTAHKVYLTAILHDVGKKHFSAELFSKTLSAMTPEEYNRYKDHASLGKDILIEAKGIPTDVIKAVHEHHESFNGTGFPNGLKKDFIHPIARVVRIADDFCRLTFTVDKSQRSVKEALRIMLEHKRVEYDPVLFAAFLKIFKIQK